MNPERWEEVQRLFDAALDRPEDEREAFLEAEASGDSELVREVLELIEAREIDKHEASPFAVSASDFEEGDREEASRLEVLVPGTRIDDFELVSVLGRGGGMGVVYLANQISLPRPVALKVLPLNLATHPETIERFRREGRIAASLQHPNIVAVHVVGETPDELFFAMQYHPSGDLAGELSRQRATGKARALLSSKGEPGHAAGCAALIADVAEGLHYAHEKDLVHRDIKPQNLLIAADHSLKVADFGLVRDDQAEGLTRDGVIMGTAAYMSPEQATRSRIKVDRRTDIYSLGAVLYEMLTLKPAFSGESDHDVIERIPVELPMAVRRLNKKVPRDLAIICQHAMEKRPVDRYQTAQEFAQDLRRFLAHESIVAHPPTPVSLVGRHLRRRWKRYALVLSAPLASLVAVWWRGQVVEQREIESALRSTEATVAQMGEREVAFGVSTNCKLTLIRLREQRERLADGDRERLDRCIEGFKAETDQMKASAVQDVLFGYAERAGLDPVNSERIRRGYRKFWEASELDLDRVDSGDDRSDPEDILQPRLSVQVVDASGQPVTAEVALQELDLEGLSPKSPRDLGKAPIDELVIPRGYYRVIVRPVGSSSREFTRLVDRSVRDVDVRCVVDASRDPPEGMLFMEGGVMTLPSLGPKAGSPHLGVTVEVEAFHVDRLPVSVGQYRAYHEAVRPDRPAFWRMTEGEPDDPWPRLMGGAEDARTMTGLSWEEARAYAEWRGVRLISEIEWDFVARGPQGRLFPDGASGLDEYFRDWPSIVPTQVRQKSPDRIVTSAMTAVDSAADYFANVLPGSDGYVPAPEEPVQLLLGNVYEWTESIAIDRSGTEPVPIPIQRVVVGECWHNREQDELTLMGRALWDTGPGYAESRLGFRCACTASP